MPDPTALALLALLWLSYFLLHSWLASLRIKYWIANHYPAVTPWYRLIFNGVAITLILPPAAYMWHLQGELLWQWQGFSAWIAHGLALLALGLFFWSLRFYDSREFLGLRQVRMRIQQVEDQEHFQISPLHRFVRHPWYSIGLVLVWSQEMDPARLVSAVMISLYFLIGSRVEERKLTILHGEIYREYRKRVPGLMPSPWSYLTQKQAQVLLSKGGSRGHGEAI